MQGNDISPADQRTPDRRSSAVVAMAAITTTGNGAGDYACYPGDVPHVFDARQPGTTAVIVIEHA